MGEVPPCTGKKLVKALKKVGLVENSKSGKGSHIKITDPKSGNSTTVPCGNLSYEK
jgi:predicted RNA binding protein YcfA (HicA-like mRNA interferase family)